MILANYRAHTTEPKPIPLTPPAVGRLNELRAPLLIMVGTLDETGCRTAADLLAEKVAGAKKIVYPGVAHMISLERPKEFIREITTFVQRVAK
jgi:pimeloyl-ACP methyl ester carboxylesterase